MMPDLQDLGTFDTREARATLQFNDAFRKVAKRLAALLKSVNYTMEAISSVFAMDTCTKQLVS
jgi:hypothetical protein